MIDGNVAQQPRALKRREAPVITWTGKGTEGMHQTTACDTYSLGRV